MAENRAPSIRTIAARAGVSYATVSLALRNDPRLPLATRQRIQALAREMGYRPDPVVAALLSQVRARQRTGTTGTIGFLTAFPTRQGWRQHSKLFVEYWDGAVERAGQLGYRLEEIWAKEPGFTGRRLTQILRARNIRGIIVSPLPVARGHLSLDWREFAAVTLGYSLYQPDLHRAAPDHFMNSMLAFRRLQRLGYRRFGLLFSPAGDERTNHAHLAALYYHQQQVRPADRIPPLLSKPVAESQFWRWFEKWAPDVIVTHQASPLRWLQSRGLRVPQEIGYFRLQWQVGDTCGGINPKGRICGATVVNLVVGQLHRNEFGIPQHPEVVLIRGEWMDGETIRDKRR